MAPRLASESGRAYHGPVAAGLRRRPLIVVLLLIAFAVRIYDLERFPPFIALEEADHGISARRIMAGEVPNLFTVAAPLLPNTALLPYAASMTLYGDSLWGLRVAQVGIGMSSIAVAYVLGRDLLGPRPALGGAFLLALLPVHVHFSRLGVSMLQGVLVVELATLVVWRASQQMRPWGHVFAGAIAAGALYTYQSSRLALVFSPAATAYLALASRQHRATTLRNVGLWVVGLLLGALPMLSFYIERPESFLANTEDVSILTPRNWQTLLAEAGDNPVGALGLQLRRIAIGLASGRDACHLYGSPGGLLGPLPFTFVVVGAAWAVVGARQPRYGLLLLWVAMGLLLGGMLTMRQPYSCRLIVALPPLALLAAIGALRLSTWLPRSLAWAPAAILGAGVVYQLVFAYFMDYRLTDYPSQRPQTELARALRHFEGSADVVVAGPPYGGNSPTAIFLGARRPPRDLRPDDPFRPASTVALIVFPAQQARIAQLQATGDLRVEPWPFPSQQFTVWRVEPTAAR
ncbi:MAG: glycosyltransferase family 39 protein [Chloroflexi bacterium]|nr:glycosyltransferase family 39 protein [Chloroflexota bacterium]